MRLFSMNGIELHDTDGMDVLHSDDYLYFSFSKNILYNKFLGDPFDFSVCMEFLEMKGKLG